MMSCYPNLLPDAPPDDFAERFRATGEVLIEVARRIGAALGDYLRANVAYNGEGSGMANGDPTRDGDTGLGAQGVPEQSKPASPGMQAVRVVTESRHS